MQQTSLTDVQLYKKKCFVSKCGLMLSLYLACLLGFLCIFVVVVRFLLIKYAYAVCNLPNVTNEIKIFTKIAFQPHFFSFFLLIFFLFAIVILSIQCRIAFENVSTFCCCCCCCSNCKFI